jgi:phenol 2-monooxygenase (NADPH)
MNVSFTIRQRHVERAILRAIEELDGNAVHSPAKVVDYRVVESAEYPIRAVIEQSGQISEMAWCVRSRSLSHLLIILSKYLIGADGARSIVRKIGQFPFPGVKSTRRWVRLDVIVETNMPRSRECVIALESKTFGNVLWLPVDNRYTRIGFVFPSSL